ncbi:MAG: hypothetical protein ACYCS7_08305 [Acidimicrobiales bacterium]
MPALFLTLGVAMVPWIIWLSLHLPAHQRSAHYRDAWVGYDIAELISLFGVAITAMRSSRLLHEFALLAGVLLAVDAWFDVMTSPAGFALHAALVDAVLIELPLAALCLWVSRHADSVARCCRQLLESRHGTREPTTSDESETPTR